MTFASRDAFPARGGVGGEDGGRFPIGGGGGRGSPRAPPARTGGARHGLGVVDPNAAARLAHAFPGAFYVELQRPYERGDMRRNAALGELAEALGVPTVATGDVHAHDVQRVRLQDALVAIKNRT